MGSPGNILRLVVVFLLGAALSVAAESVPPSGGGRTGSVEAGMAAGMLHFEEGQFREAIDSFKGAIRLDPDSVRVLLALGVTYFRLNLYPEAAVVFERVIRARPESAQAHTRLGFTLSQMNLQRDAVEAFKKAISYQFDLAQAHWGLGLAYRQLGFHEEALASFTEVVRLKPDFADARYDRAEVCLITGRKCTAIEEYNILKELDEELAAKLFDLILK